MNGARSSAGVGGRFLAHGLPRGAAGPVVSGEGQHCGAERSDPPLPGDETDCPDCGGAEPPTSGRRGSIPAPRECPRVGHSKQIRNCMLMSICIGLCGHPSDPQARSMAVLAGLQPRVRRKQDAQPDRTRQHPLPGRHARDDAIDQVRRATSAARHAPHEGNNSRRLHENATSFMRTRATTHPREPAGADAPA